MILQHAWWASDRPLARLMAGYHEYEQPRPTLWIRTFDPVFIAGNGNDADRETGYQDLPLGVFMHKEALTAFVRFMDAYSAQIEAARLPQLERTNEEETGAQPRPGAGDSIQSDESGEPSPGTSDEQDGGEERQPPA